MLRGLASDYRQKDHYKGSHCIEWVWSSLFEPLSSQDIKIRERALQAALPEINIKELCAKVSNTRRVEKSLGHSQ